MKNDMTTYLLLRFGELVSYLQNAVGDGVWLWHFQYGPGNKAFK